MAFARAVFAQVEKPIPIIPAEAEIEYVLWDCDWLIDELFRTGCVSCENYLKLKEGEPIKFFYPFEYKLRVLKEAPKV